MIDGKALRPAATPNYRKKPLTIRGPLVDQIDQAVATVLRELEEGLTLSRSGFKTRHVYPERVVKEAIVNAVVHRDYRLNRDISIRLFDDRIEVESPGTFPGTIKPANIHKAGSKARNPLVAMNLREFAEPPNIDGGEGVPMMFAEMAAAKLYPPQYRQNTEAQTESVTVTLLNLERPSAWDEVSHWIDTRGSIANAELREIAGVDTLRASKMLVTWVEQGLLEVLPGRGKRNTAYCKPARPRSKPRCYPMSWRTNRAAVKSEAESTTWHCHCYLGRGRRGGASGLQQQAFRQRKRCVSGVVCYPRHQITNGRFTKISIKTTACERACSLRRLHTSSA